MTDKLIQAAQQALEALHYGKANKAVTILREALEQPVQESVACRFCHSEKGCWTWQCYHCGEIDDVQKPTPPAAQPEQRKPLTHIQAKALVAKYGNDLLKLVFQTEAAHGIKE